MSAPAPQLFTIPQGVPFVDAMAEGLIGRHGAEPLAFSRVTVLLPNRRACRALAEAFLRRSGGRAMLLPAIQPLGDVDEEELTLSGAATLDLPPAVSTLRRQLLLTRLVLGHPGIATPAEAARLAAELARLIDQMQIERLDPARLADLAPAEFAAHWQITLEFLRLVTEHWPRVLEGEGAIDPAARRNLLLEALAAAWKRQPPADPVYAAGSTGSIPAAADLLAAIAYLPQGAIVLPGFDPDLDEASYAALDEDPAHPQAGMKQLLVRLGAVPDEVQLWPAGLSTAAGDARARLLREVLRPARTSEAWVGARIEPAALEGLRLLEAPGAREEAAAIALLLRQVLEMPGRTGALVTADRSLARRVAAELGRYGIAIDSSAGRPLGETPPGALLRLVADLAAAALHPIALLACLKHPLASGGQRRDAFRRRVRKLERRVLRGPRPEPGIQGLRAALEAAGGDDSLGPWLERLGQAMAPLTGLMEAARAAPADLLAAQVGFAEWLAFDTEAGERLWAGEAGEAAADFVHELAAALGDQPPLDPADWPALFETLMSGQAVRESFGHHPRLAILGPIEARLQQADLLILGSLNEGSWPPEPASDPWLSRPMRQAFGLPPPERRIGQSAHDFQQAATAPHVVLSRAVKLDGTPTLASRWLLRLETLLRGSGIPIERLRADAILAAAATLDRPQAIRPLPAPEPRPPLASRPRRLSVTEIETWIRDPYAIYARRVLGLKMLEPLDADPGAAERGSFIHEALDRFVTEIGDGELPADAAARLEECGRLAFGAAMQRPGVRAFWWPRFRRISAWFLDFERDRRRQGIRPLATECTGRLRLDGPGGAFDLAGKADRIDRLTDGSLAILDYKTGQPPSTRQVESGLAPQLPLEALIAGAGGFEGIEGARVGSLDYIRLGGGAVPGEAKPVKGDPTGLAAMAGAGLKSLILRFDDPAMPYRSRTLPKLLRQGGDYDHLARVLEWSVGEAAESEDEP